MEGHAENKTITVAQQLITSKQNKVTTNPIPIRRDTPIFRDAHFNNACNANRFLFEESPRKFITHRRDIGSVDCDSSCSVPILPTSYPLQLRNSLQLSNDDAMITKVVSQTIDFLRLNSIQYSYHKENGRFHCCCSPKNTLRFVIQLWRRRAHDESSNKKNQNKDSSGHDNKTRNINGNGDNNNTDFMVELQRHHGCRVEMMRVRKGLFQVLKGGGKSCNTNARADKMDMNAKQQILVTTGVTNKKTQKLQQQQLPFTCLRRNSNNKSSSKARVESMEISLRLLESTRTDEIQAGMESLAAATNSSTKDGYSVSQELLGGEIGSLGERLRNHVFQYVQTAASRTQQQQQQKEWWKQCGGKSGNHHSHLWQMQTLSLQVCANAIDQATNANHGDGLKSPSHYLVQHHGKNCSTIKKLTKVFTENLELANYRPEEAALSAKCLRLCLERGLIEQQHPLSMAHALEASTEHGLVCRLPSSLGEESKKLMERVKKRQ